MQVENPWWSPPHEIPEPFAAYEPRAYFNLLFPLIGSLEVRRAVLLMGPRRVGKTVILHQVIGRLLSQGTHPASIAYVSVDHPLYNGLQLHDFIEHFSQATARDVTKEKGYVIFDEIQYLKEWETQLKALVDEHANIRFVASGSAAAALRLKSIESGAGRFTDFLLPPLTFHEYLELLGAPAPTGDAQPTLLSRAVDIAGLNERFIDYLNFGGYPEVVFSDQVRRDPSRFIKSDIIDKVLLRDLPSLYGIEDIQELNYLFTTLAYNTADELSLDELAKNSGVSKNTLRRYIEYLEAAFLIKVVHRIDHHARRLQRATSFKVYLTNPSMRAALFTPMTADDEAMGALAETGVFSQWFHHAGQSLHYARWIRGEIDLVGLDRRQKPAFAVEVKWSDRILDHPEELKGLIGFCKKHGLTSAILTTRTRHELKLIDGVGVLFIPTALYCHLIGYHLVRGRNLPPFHPIAPAGIE